MLRYTWKNLQHATANITDLTILASNVEEAREKAMVVLRLVHPYYKKEFKKRLEEEPDIVE